MLAALIAGLAWGQDGPAEVFEPIVLVRPRFSSGFTEGIALGVLEDRAVTHRARIGMYYQRGTVSTQVVAQLASGWERGPRAYEFVPPGVDFYEGWGRLDGDLFGKVEGSVVAGRIPVLVHDGRLISHDDFSWNGRSVDGLLISGNLGLFHLHSLTYRYPDPDPTAFRGAVANWVGFRGANAVNDWVIELVTVNDYQAENVRTTAGPFFSWRKNRIHLQTELYSQTIATDLLEPVTGGALLFSQLAGITMGPERLVSVKTRWDVSSGDLDGDGPGFSAPLGDSYRYFGHQGLFQNGRATNGRGVADGALLTAVTLHPRLEIEADGHQIWFLDAGSAGQEFDFLIRYHVSPFARIEVGTSSFFGTATTQDRYGLTPISSAEYLQLEVGAPPLR